MLQNCTVRKRDQIEELFSEKQIKIQNHIIVAVDRKFGNLLPKMFESRSISEFGGFFSLNLEYLQLLQSKHS